MIVYRAPPESLPVGRFVRLQRLHPLLGERAGVRASHLPNCILYLPLKAAFRPQTVDTLNRYTARPYHNWDLLDRFFPQFNGSDARFRNQAPAQSDQTEAGAYFLAVSRLASQSRDCVWPSRSVSIFPLMVSPVILPLYLAVTLLPWDSRVTVNEISSALTLPFSIGLSVAAPWRPAAARVPVSFSPSCFSLSVVFRSGPPSLPGMLQVQVPVESPLVSWA